MRLLLNVGWGSPSKAQGWQDMNLREWVYLLPLGLLVLYLGLAPGKALDFMRPSIDNLMNNFEQEKNLAIDEPEQKKVPEIVVKNKWEMEIESRDYNRIKTTY